MIARRRLTTRSSELDPLNKTAVPRRILFAG